MRFFHLLHAAIAAGLMLAGLGSAALAQTEDTGDLFAQAMADSLLVDDDEAPDRAFEAFGTLCATGLAKACFNAAVLAHKGFDYAGALGWMRKACDFGKMTACYFVAAELTIGETPDEPEARALFGKACAQGVTAACLRFGEMLEYGIGGPDDARKAFDVYKRACAAPSGVACDRLATFFSYRDGFDSDDIAKRATLETACGLNTWSACSSLAEMLRQGQGGQADEPRATELFAKVCLDGEVMSQCDVMLLTLDK